MALTTPHKQALQNKARGLLGAHLRTGEMTHSGQVHLQPGGERAGVRAENQPERASGRTEGKAGGGGVLVTRQVLVTCTIAVPF